MKGDHFSMDTVDEKELIEALNKLRKERRWKFNLKEQIVINIGRLLMGVLGGLTVWGLLRFV